MMDKCASCNGNLKSSIIYFHEDNSYCYKCCPWKCKTMIMEKNKSFIRKFGIDAFNLYNYSQINYTDKFIKLIKNPHIVLLNIYLISRFWDIINLEISY